METSGVLSKRLRQVCDEKGIGYAQLAEKSGIPVRVVYRMYRGITSSANIFTMLKICDALEISLDEFFGSEEFMELRK